MIPFNKLIDWLKKEKELGVNEPQSAVLSTVTTVGIPHSRVVAIREIQSNSLLFFTQQKTRKVAELLNNPHATLNFQFSLQERQVIIEGTAKPLLAEENQAFWQTLLRERQLRFSAYSPTSGQVINDLNQLEERKKALIKQFANEPIPMSEFYCGFRFTPETFIFYTVGSISFSEVIRYIKTDNVWQQELLSP